MCDPDLPRADRWRIEGEGVPVRNGAAGDVCRWFLSPVALSSTAQPSTEGFLAPYVRLNLFALVVLAKWVTPQQSEPHSLCNWGTSVHAQRQFDERLWAG